MNYGFLLIICGLIASFEMNGQPKVELIKVKETNDPVKNTLVVSVKLSIKKEIIVFKNVFGSYCPYEIDCSNFRLAIEEYNKGTGSYTKKGCNADIDCNVYLNGSLGPEIKYKDTSVLEEVIITPGWYGKGRFKGRNKFNFIQNGIRKSVWSSYIYFKL